MTHTAMLAPSLGAKESRMNITTTLMAPWRATPRSLAWFTVAVFGVFTAGALALGITTPDPKGQLIAVIIFAVGVGLFWVLMMPTLFLLAFDARRLRLPGIAGNAAISTVVYGILTVAIPTLVEGAFGWNTSRTALVTALAEAGGLAFMLLPRWVSMWMGFVPAIYIVFHNALHFPSPLDPRFLHWGLLALALLLWADIHHWLRRPRGDVQETFGYRSTIIMQRRGNFAAGNFLAWSNQPISRTSDSLLLRRRPDWAQPVANLHRVGPDHPTIALRVALGGWYLPQRLAGRVRRQARTLLPVLLIVPVVWLVTWNGLSGHSLYKILMIAGVSAIGWVGVFGGLMLSISTPAAAQMRWRRVNAELPLLALLPGLGNAESVRQHLLRAALGIPFTATAMLFACVLATALAMHLPAQSLVLLALVQAGAGISLVALVLAVRGGRPVPRWLLIGIYTVLFVLMGASSFAAIAPFKQIMPMAAAFQPALIAAWIGADALLVWLARRDWRALQRRPHPFLANES